MKYSNWKLSWDFFRSHLLACELARPDMGEKSYNGTNQRGVGVPGLHDAFTGAVS